MSSTSTSSRNKSSKQQSPKRMLISLLIILALAAGIYAFKKYVLPKLQNNAPQDNSAAAVGENQPDTAPTKPENDSLFLGNPSNAVSDVANHNNYLIEKKQYTLSYNNSTLNPNWVAWHLGKENLGPADRSDDFRPDTDLPAEYYAVVKADYQYPKYGFDRGHVCPSADRTSTQEDNSATFYMTNMIPQSPDCNRIVWKDFEAYERSLVAHKGKELYIVAGPYGQGGQSGTGTWNTIDLVSKKGEGKQIVVPSHCWKIVLVLDEGKDDLNRINGDTEIIALMMPNAQGINKGGSWEQYLTTVDDIEAKTGFDFMSVIPNQYETLLESKTYQCAK